MCPAALEDPLVVWHHGDLPRLLCKAQAPGKWLTTFWGNSIPCRTLTVHCPKIHL